LMVHDAIKINNNSTKSFPFFINLIILCIENIDMYYSSLAAIL
jgi:hypothetical protein